jgi:hypothetical protein
MRPSAEGALARGRTRRGPAIPGIIGRWFIAWRDAGAFLRRFSDIDLARRAAEQAAGSEPFQL